MKSKCPLPCVFLIVRAAALTVLLFLSATAAEAAIPDSERQVLISLYNSTNGPGWTDSTGWLGAAGTECSWFGITCDGGGAHVTRILLVNNQLTGTIPSVTALTSLQTLALSSNQLTGSIPSLTGLTSLQYAYFQANQLTGTIPSLTGLTSLVNLGMNSNQLTGSIPDLTGLTSLNDLELNSNQLTGGIPSLSGLTNLGYLFLDNNHLTGSIPPLSGLTSLINLHLNDNQLTGSIPPMANVKYLFLHNNYLAGPVPAPPASLVAFDTLLCSNFLTSGGSTIDAAWNVATGMDWLACQLPNKRGDVNSDGKIDVLDVFYLINSLFAAGPSPVSQCRADVKGDAVIDVLDVFYLINYLFASGPAPAAPTCTS